MRRDALDEGRRWLEQAEADRHGAQVLMDGGVYHLVCFLAQQVAEKAIKAFLYATGEELVIGHSVEALCRQASEQDKEFSSLREVAGPLDGYYIPTRYPNGLPDSIPARVYGQTSAKDVLSICDQVLDMVRRKMAAM